MEWLFFTVQGSNDDSTCLKIQLFTEFNFGALSKVIQMKMLWFPNRVQQLFLTVLHKVNSFKNGIIIDINLSCALSPYS